jgi:hypothetical protein
VNDARFWKLVVGACCLPIAWAAVRPDPPFYPHLQQFCFGTLACIATARTLLGFPTPLRRSQLRVAWAFSVFLLALFALEASGAFALRYRAALIPVALMAPALCLHERRGAS